MTKSSIRFSSFPRTEPPPFFILKIIDAFRVCETAISTLTLTKGLTSDEVLTQLRPQLKSLEFEIEAGKHKEDRIERPVFYGENGVPTLNYQIDAYHSGWRCGLEVEAGRGWMGNAVYRDLVQALVMVHVDHLVLAVVNRYKYKSRGKGVYSTDYENTVAVADALYGHSRIKLPYGLTIIGY